MYERFTDRARKVMVLANQEAKRFEHEYIGTEHILLGLIKEGSGVAAHVLKDLDIELDKVRRETERLVARGPDMVTMSKLPQTPSAKKAIEFAMHESRSLNHNYVGTEHLLLGLLHDNETVATQVLTNLGLRLDVVRQKVLLLLGHDISSPRIQGDSRSPKQVRRLFEKQDLHALATPPQISKQPGAVATLIAVDIGNSGIKLGQFASASVVNAAEKSLPEPIATLELSIAHETGLFDLKLLSAWCESNLSADTRWLIGSVHRGAGELLASTISAWSKQLNISWPARRLTYQDVPIPIRVDEPAKTGIDRLLAAVAANRLRALDRAAIVVDLGTAITVDLVEADGGFAGGAILPGIGMAGRALADQTDALPHIVLEHTETPPSPLGKTTRSCIEAGLYWGAVGAVGELVAQLSADLPAQPEIFITGGAGRSVAGPLDKKSHVRYVPHLVLAGIALLDDSNHGKEG